MRSWLRRWARRHQIITWRCPQCWKLKRTLGGRTWREAPTCLHTFTVHAGKPAQLMEALN